MRIYLDLLPAERKEELKNKSNFNSAIRQEILFLTPFILVVVFLVCINMVLKIQLDGFDMVSSFEKSQQNGQDLEKYEQKFKEINNQVQNFNDIHSNHVNWFGVIKNFNELVSDNITISEFTTKNYHIFTIGKAKTREELLVFKGKIESSDCFINVGLPLSNLVVKTDVDFQMDFDVKKECLKMK